MAERDAEPALYLRNSLTDLYNQWVAEDSAFRKSGSHSRSATRTKGGVDGKAFPTQNLSTIKEHPPKR